MSDIEDEMDIDAPVAGNSISFGGDTKKGKRSAANLPVEAEDSLPWVEKYRPNSLADVEGHQDIIATINKFVDSNRLPHLLLYGPPGTGKTSTVLALARRIYGNKNMRQMVLELNASDDRGIDVVREQIKTFSSTKQIFSAAPKSGDASLATFKLIILDEADAMTSTAQMALRRIMEKYTANTRFCIIANYTHKLSPALLSRCTRFRFSPLKERDIRNLVDKVVEDEKVNITQDATESLVTLSKGDMRRALNVLQACHASSTPLQEPGKPAMDPNTIVRDQITQTTIYDCIAAPHPSDIKFIIETLLSTNDMTQCLRTVNNLKTLKGLALADILTAVSDELVKNDVPPQVMVTWMSGLADIEYRLSGGGSEAIQTGAAIGIVRTGVELMENGKKPGKEDKVLNTSFSELLVTTERNNLTGPLKHDYTDTPSDLSSEPNHEPKAPDPSVFSHPINTKKREGYGFSYSEPLWYDSDEYPDTECDWDPNAKEQTEPFEVLFDQDSSFDDIVVMRDVGSFHIAKPQRTLQCTKATREDTVRLKQRAKMLFRWDESGDVYSSLVGRLERMVYNDLEKKISDQERLVPSIVQCASRLRDFLQRNKEERVDTGESRRAVEHEIEWATWLVEASRTGVMHLKTRGCTCRPDWEEEG
ncbi:hypothetical protein E8E12_008007 [Didymella heteroderae]|uniref:Replication factor C subunit 3 n=1 Tax=Didymella heteroderae TaxID=1769908 RepID=A0A9P4WUD3_9PLEO|nr:hypothetical protein E8E12_008007 [Didymella heteroderae]